MIFYDILWFSMILLWSPYPSIILYHIYGYIYIWIISPNINGWRCQIRSYHPNCSTALLVFMIGSGVILSTGRVNPWISACWNDMTEIYRTKNPFSKSPLSPQYCQSPVISWLRKPMNYSYYSSNIFEPKTPVKLERFASTRAVNGGPQHCWSILEPGNAGSFRACVRRSHRETAAEVAEWTSYRWVSQKHLML